VEWVGPAVVPSTRPRRKKESVGVDDSVPHTDKLSVSSGSRGPDFKMTRFGERNYSTVQYSISPIALDYFSETLITHTVTSNLSYNK
jgi:hypothetical protein